MDFIKENGELDLAKVDARNYTDFHGLFIEDAANRLRVCDDILSSDTLEGVYTRFSVAPAIADAL